MSRFIINGPKTLKGEFKVNGFKNAATPIIAATLLIKKECVLDNIPKVNDVEKMIEILKELGGTAEWTGKNQITINTAKVEFKKINEKLIKTMRSSVLLIGPLLSRFKTITIPEPGGCFLGNRPIDTHLCILEQFGAQIIQHKDEHGKIEYEFSLKNPVGKNIILPEFSVTATENAIMLASMAKGRTNIKLAAQEPHIRDLIGFLSAAGAKIEEKSCAQLTINGVDNLNGVSYKIIPDMLEVGTLAVAGALIGKGIILTDIQTEHLDSTLLKLKQIGVKLEIDHNKDKTQYIKILPTNRGDLKSFTLQALPYPGFPTDMQEPFSLLATQCKGASLIHDPLFEDRMRHIPELIKMGARCFICDTHRAIITGPSNLKAYELKSPNIRAGGMFTIAGLLAEGETILHDVENTIDRGYERFDERLNELGAEIKRIDY